MKFNRIFNGGKIRQLYWIITNDCNLKCKFCIREISNISNKKFLQLSDIEMLIPQVKSFLPNVNMIISGGEPLLHPNFILILKKMKQHFKKVYLVSNGTLPHYFKAHSNIFLGIKIQISIDGTKNNHDKIRGKGAFDKTIDSIKFLLSNKNTVTVASTVSTENISSMFELYKIIKELGVKRWKVSREIPGGDAFQRAQIHISA